VCHWCSYHILTSSVIYYWIDKRQHGIYLFYMIKKQTTTAFFKSFSVTGKPIDKTFLYLIFTCSRDYCPLWRTRKKPFDVIRCLYETKQSHWLLSLARNSGWSRKITPLSNLIQTWAIISQRPKHEEAPTSPGVYIQGQRIFVEKARNIMCL